MRPCSLLLPPFWSRRQRYRLCKQDVCSWSCGQQLCLEAEVAGGLLAGFSTDFLIASLFLLPFRACVKRQEKNKFYEKTGALSYHFPKALESKCCCS